MKSVKGMPNKSLLVVACLLFTAIQLSATSEKSTPEKITLIAGGQKVELKQSAVRWDKAFYLPVASLSALGMKSSVKSANKSITAIYDSKKLTLPISVIKEIQYINLSNLVQGFGGDLEWNEKDKSIAMLAKLESIEFEKDTVLKIKAALPVRWKVFAIPAPDRLVVDITGCLPPKKTMPVNLPKNIIALRTGEPVSKTVRIVLDMQNPIKIINPKSALQNELTISWNNTTAPVPPTTVEVANIAVKLESEDSASISIETNIRTNALLRRDLNPHKVVVEIPSVSNKVAKKDEAFKHPLIKSLSVTQKADNTLRLEIELNRISGVSLASFDKSVKISLSQPVNSKGELKEKIIVLDPGHGGGTGANTKSYLSRTNNMLIFEDDVVLAICERTAEHLSLFGATVVMTRSDNSNVPLRSRPEMANEINADLYISVHANSNSVPNSASGSCVYYHCGSSSGSALAEAIQYEIGKISGLPNAGAFYDKSLSRFAATGMGVLRLSNMPAVLIETAYLNHDLDRSCLLDPEWQDKIAMAIVKGIQRYMGEDPIADSAYVPKKQQEIEKPKTASDNKPNQPVAQPAQNPAGIQTGVPAVND